jgi:hypothetical protein
MTGEDTHAVRVILLQKLIRLAGLHERRWVAPSLRKSSRPDRFRITLPSFNGEGVIEALRGPSKRLGISPQRMAREKTSLKRSPSQRPPTGCNVEPSRVTTPTWSSLEVPLCGCKISHRKSKTRVLFYTRNIRNVVLNTAGKEANNVPYRYRTVRYRYRTHIVSAMAFAILEPK